MYIYFQLFVDTEEVPNMMDVYGFSRWLTSVFNNKFPNVTLAFKLNSPVSFIRVTSIPLALIKTGESTNTHCCGDLPPKSAAENHLKHVRANNMQNRRGAKTI